jgi:hypothetical protein
MDHGRLTIYLEDSRVSRSSRCAVTRLSGLRIRYTSPACAERDMNSPMLSASSVRFISGVFGRTTLLFAPLALEQVAIIYRLHFVDYFSYKARIVRA